MGSCQTRAGSRFPFGMQYSQEGTNFSFPCRYAHSVELLLFEDALSKEPFQVIQLDPQINRTYFTWHVFVEALPIGTAYTWRADGPSNPSTSGLRFDSGKSLLDPWAVAVSDALWDRQRASAPGDNTATAMRGIVVDVRDYDWDGDEPLNHCLEKAVIYEAHVGGFTRHPSSGVHQPGTFAGIVEQIPYLEALGVTDIELMPVMAFDEQDVPEGPRARGLHNFWGYSPHSFYSPHPGYCTAPHLGSHLKDFRGMVKALHQAKIGVIMDVVFNHTAEGGADGPTINFKGFWNNAFYHLDRNDRSVYRDYTGCGNTINCNHPLVSLFLIRCLEYWVEEMHVDGFRFDLASVFTRGEDGQAMRNAPFVWGVEFSQVLNQTRIIAEAWDAGGLYQVGAFPGLRMAEWNGRYRDVIRRFVRGDSGLIGEVATRISGSSDLYEPRDRLPINSINFITCHDGFTLQDLVSYNRKHNEANGEDNRDGTDENLSWNCGFEGETKDLAIVSLRRRQTRNFVAILLLSQGVPMLLAGDEVLRSQQGNNNAYCHDNPIGWLDWHLAVLQEDMLRFVGEMIAFRKRHPALMRRRFLTGAPTGPEDLPDISWHGPDGNDPHWNDPEGRFLAYTLAGLTSEEESIHVIFNLSNRSLRVPLPALSGKEWHLAVDTSRRSPEEIIGKDRQQAIPHPSTILAPTHSVVVCEARKPAQIPSG